MDGIPTDPLSGRISVRDFVADCVAQELSHRVALRVRQPSLVSLCGVMNDKNAPAVDVEDAISAAQRAITARSVSMIVDGVAVESLDQMIEVTAATDIIFLPRRKVRGL